MYPLLPWKWLTSALALFVMIAVYADDFAPLVGLTVSPQSLVRYLPLLGLAVLFGVFGPTNHGALWRRLWRKIPALNRWAFPDLNGVWVGSTQSNWPVVAQLRAAALSEGSISQEDIASTPLQQNVIAVHIETSLFVVKIKVFATSTNGESISIAARPWIDQHTGRIHITNVYRQKVTVPQLTDEPNHLGAADLEFDHNETGRISGEYWTRRVWRTGMNTAGIIELEKRSDGDEDNKSLRQFAEEEIARLDPA